MHEARSKFSWYSGCLLHSQQHPNDLSVKFCKYILVFVVNVWNRAKYPRYVFNMFNILSFIFIVMKTKIYLIRFVCDPWLWHFVFISALQLFPFNSFWKHFCYLLDVCSIRQTFKSFLYLLRLFLGAFSSSFMLFQLQFDKPHKTLLTSTTLLACHFCYNREPQSTVGLTWVTEW